MATSPCVSGLIESIVQVFDEGLHIVIGLHRARVVSARHLGKNNWESTVLYIDPRR